MGEPAQGPVLGKSRAKHPGTHPPASRTDGAIRFCLYAITLGTPLVMWPWAYSTFRLPKEVWAASFAWLALGLWGSAKIAEGVRAMVPRGFPLAFTGLAFLSWAWITYFWNHPAAGVSDYVSLLLYASLYVVICSRLRIAHGWFLLKLVVAAACMNSLATFFQRQQKFPLKLSLLPAAEVALAAEEERLLFVGLLDNANTVGIYIGVALVVAGIGFWKAQELRGRLIWLVAVGCLLPGFLYVQTFAAYFSFAGALVALAVFIVSSRSILSKKRWIWIAAVPLTVALGLGAFARSEATFGGRLRTTWEGLKRGDWDSFLHGRYYPWKIAWDMVGERPWVGHGLGAYDRSFFERKLEFEAREKVIVGLGQYFSQAHNEYLQAWAELGLPGLLLGLAVLGEFFWRVFRRLWRQRDRPDPQAQLLLLASSCSVAAIAVNALANFPLHLAATASLLVILLGVAMSVEQQKNQE